MGRLRTVTPADTPAAVVPGSASAAGAQRATAQRRRGHAAAACVTLEAAAGHLAFAAAATTTPPLGVCASTEALHRCPASSRGSRRRRPLAVELRASAGSEAPQQLLLLRHQVGPGPPAAALHRLPPAAAEA
mmetsp:Transcript_121439/g.348957  ORF Transcript_121439/g.348957 Transcript_121439/m.348957 type:complete len:132 (-) Transcript_121439:389-784(-)